MYRIYINKLLLPIAPQEITESIKSKNKTINLINDGEVNIKKPTGLTEFSFDVTLPAFNYPYLVSTFRPQQYYLDKFEKFKKYKSIQLLIVRERPSGLDNGNNTLMRVTLEDYSIKDSADEGFDLVVTLNFKQYREYGTQKFPSKKKKVDSTWKTFQGETYKIKLNDTLEKIVRKKMSPNSDTLKRNRDRLWKKNKKVIEDAAQKQYGTGSYNGELLVAGTKIVIAKSVEDGRFERKFGDASPEKK